MRLEITSTRALIGMQKQDARLELQGGPAQLQMKNELPRIQVESTLPKIMIDQSACFSESGLKSCAELTADNATYSYQKMMESVGRIVDQGNALTDIHLGGNPFADQALYNAYDQFDHEFGMVTMPKSRPQITLIRGENTITVQGGTVDIQAQPTPVQGQYQAGKVEIYMQQMQSLNISVRQSGGALDLLG